MSEVVLEQRRGPALWITMNRPDKLNALSGELVEALRASFRRAAADEEVKVVVLTGAGRAFSAGFDISEEVESEIASAERWHDLLSTDVSLGMELWSLPRPTIAAVRGWCLAGACELAMACDMIVAADDARFGEPEIRYGSGPVSLLMPFVLGQKKTNELLFTGDWVDAQEAERLGLVNRVAPADGLEAAVDELVAKIAPTPLPVLRLTKLALNRAYEAMGLRQAVNANLDLSAILNAAETPEQREFDRIVADAGPEGRAGVARQRATGGRDAGRGHTPIPPELAALLERFHFDRVPFEELRARLIAAARRSRGRCTASASRSRCRPRTSRIRCPRRARPSGERAAALGRELIERGEVAAVVLAGGMATRFGSQVKALAPVLDGPRPDLPRPQAGRSDALRRRRHADDELRDARRAGRGRRGHAACSSRRSSCRCACVPTARSSSATTARPRRTRRATATSRTRSSSRARSSATAQAACARSSSATSTTSARRSIPRSSACTAHSAGPSPPSSSPSARATPAGCPVRRADGSLAIAEAFRVPEGFPHEQFPLFNTNTLWIDVAALEAPGRLHLVRGPQVGRRARGDPARAPRRRAHLVACVALRARAARRRRIALRPGQGRGRSGSRAGADRRHLPRAPGTRRLIGHAGG